MACKSISIEQHVDLDAPHQVVGVGKLRHIRHVDVEDRVVVVEGDHLVCLCVMNS